MTRSTCAYEGSATMSDQPVCDWQDCQDIAVNYVRRDVPRGVTFDTHIWHRCEEHTPYGESRGLFVGPVRERRS